MRAVRAVALGLPKDQISISSSEVASASGFSVKGTAPRYLDYCKQRLGMRDIKSEPREMRQLFRGGFVASNATAKKPQYSQVWESAEKVLNAEMLAARGRLIATLGSTCASH